MYYNQESGALVNLTLINFTSLNSLCGGLLHRALCELSKIPVRIDRLLKIRRKNKSKLNEEKFNENFQRRKSLTKKLNEKLNEEEFNENFNKENFSAKFSAITRKTTILSEKIV